MSRHTRSPRLSLGRFGQSHQRHASSRSWPSGTFRPTAPSSQTRIRPILCACHASRHSSPPPPRWSAKPPLIKELSTPRLFNGRSASWTTHRWLGLRWPGDGQSSPARKAVSIHCSSAPPARCARPSRRPPPTPQAATPDEIAARVDLTRAMNALHLNMASSLDVAYLTRDIAATSPTLTARARQIAMRAQGEAEIAAEQGNTAYPGITWATERQIAANQVIPLRPLPALDSSRPPITSLPAATAPSAQPQPSMPANLHRRGNPFGRRPSGAPSPRRKWLSKTRLHEDLSDESKPSEHTGC